MKSTQSIAFVLFAVKPAKQLWCNHQQQYSKWFRESNLRPSPLHREKLEFIVFRILFSREIWLRCQGLFQHSLMTYLALFKEKKILLTLFLSSKSQEKQDLHRWKSFREHTWQQRQPGRYRWSTLFGRVSRDRSFQWRTISNHSNCQLKIIQPFPSISSHLPFEQASQISSKRVLNAVVLPSICFCWIRLLANVDLVKDNKTCFTLALKSLSSIC